MRRPTTIFGGLWRLARLYPRQSLAWVVGIVAFVAVLTTGGSDDNERAVEACPFERTWFQGDLHFWQELTFEPAGTGVWSTGGMASDAPHKRIEFRWQRDRSTLTAESAGERRSARYEIEQRDWGCSLRFDQPFVADDQQSTHWSDVR